jgi:hypothetical protein
MKIKKYSYIKNEFPKSLITIILVLFFYEFSIAQIPGTLEKQVRVGSLQNQFTAYGFERAFTGSEYIGMKWPADYLFQDNSVIERAWIAADNFTDEKNKNWEKYGVYFDATTVSSSIFPLVHKQTAKFPYPTIFVDGISTTAIYESDIDTIDSNIIPDRIVTNIVNTKLGLTMKKRIYAFSQQYHDNYFIKEYTFINTGNVDYDDEIELTNALNGVKMGWALRYSTSRDGASKYDNQQSWGKYSWVTKRGDIPPNDYPSHVGESITEANPIVEWLRCSFTWAGQSDLRTDWDNIGAPDKNGNGRLAAPQHAGVVTIHVDKSAADSTDDANQPAISGWHAGDVLLSIADQLNINDAEGMKQVYSFLSGTPHGGASQGDTNRYFEDVGNLTSITERKSPWNIIHNDVGGTGIWICYGPFDIPFGDSIKIIEAEAVSGLSRKMCEEIGARWLQAYNDPSDNGPFDLPGGGTTDDLDFYKNSWVYTGWDSILQTFGRAKRNFDLDYIIPQPPLPPPLIEVSSGGDRITISWQASESESEPDFAGYKIYRAIGKVDTNYEEIYNGPKDVHIFEDTSPVRGFAYYYYVVAYNDGSNNTTGEANPMGQLHSSRFYSRTTEPAFLQRPAGKSLEDIRIVPNPYNIKARDINYPGEYNKIGFLNIPAFCSIKIFTERGDLIITREHTDGSGDEYWNSITSSRQVVVSGLYIAFIEVTRDYYDPESNVLLYKKGDNIFKKFIIIR